MTTAEQELQSATRHLAAGRSPEAAAAYRLAARLAPGRAEAWDGLGRIAYHAGRLEEAERLIRRAVERQPDNADFRDHLGVILRALQRGEEAVQEYEAALALHPDRPTTLSNFGNALCDIGQAERAVEVLRRAVSLEPNSAGIRTNLARALLRCSRAGDALEQLEQVRMSAPSPETEVDYGHALLQLERYEEAIAAYRRAAAAGQRNHELFHNLATALQDFGRMDEAAEAYREALAIRPDSAPSRRQLATIRKYETHDREAEELEERLNAPNLGVADRADLHMGLAKIFDDIGDPRKAFFHLQAGNQHIRSTIDYSVERNSDYIDALIETFDTRFFAERSDFGLDTEAPLFILGMPRSGTSLIEQILASHPEVHGAGELKKLNELFAGLRRRLKPDLGMPRIARLMDRALADDLAREYLAYLTGFNPHTRYVTDKMPFNFRVLGLIALLYPKARIIHCRRDPRDIGLSCYFARFNELLSFSFNLVEIGRYYRDYERVMAHWAGVIRNPVLNVQYEDLVADQKGQTLRMLEFCGLEWDERCLKFYDTERVVLTASNWQVRQPVYASSIGRWRNYKDYLEPLIAALEIRDDNAGDFEQPGDAFARAS